MDETRKKGMFVLTGSQNFQLLNTINQSLAGRTAILKLLPFSINEISSFVKRMNLDELLIKGFYPRIYNEKLNPYHALSFYFETYVERDVRSLIRLKDLSTFQKFVRLCAGRIGSLLNLSSLGNEVGVSHTTVREWISILEASYIVFLLQPHHKNFNKRITKSPKLYFHDVGLAAYLLGIETTSQIQRDPLRGNLFENLIISDILKKRFESVKPSNLSFFRDTNGNEVDLILTSGNDLLAIEIKSGQTITKEFLRGINYFESVKKSEKVTKSIIYGGKTKQERGDVTIYPYRKCYECVNI